MIIILIRSSSQKHLFLFHCKNTNTQKRNFFSHQQIYSPPLPESLSSAFSSVRANELPIHFSKTSPPLVQWFPSSLAYSRSLFPQLYLLSPTISSVFPLVLHHSQEKNIISYVWKVPFPLCTSWAITLFDVGWIVFLKRRYVKVLILSNSQHDLVWK